MTSRTDGFCPKGPSDKRFMKVLKHRAGDDDKSGIEAVMIGGIEKRGGWRDEGKWGERGRGIRIGEEEGRRGKFR